MLPSPPDLNICCFWFPDLNNINTKTYIIIYIYIYIIIYTIIIDRPPHAEDRSHNRSGIIDASSIRQTNRSLKYSYITLFTEPHIYINHIYIYLFIIIYTYIYIYKYINIYMCSFINITGTPGSWFKNIYHELYNNK